MLSKRSTASGSAFGYGLACRTVTTQLLTNLAYQIRQKIVNDLGKSSDSSVERTKNHSRIWLFRQHGPIFITGAAPFPAAAGGVFRPGVFSRGAHHFRRARALPPGRKKPWQRSQALPGLFPGGELGTQTPYFLRVMQALWFLATPRC